MSNIRPNSIANLDETERKLAERLDTAVAAGLELSADAGGMRFVTAQQVMEFAKMMAISQIGVRKHLRGNPGACLAITVQAVEWRMSPYAVANKSYLVNDQIAFESQLIQAVILQRAPIKGRFRFAFSGEGQKRKVRVEVTTSDGEVVDYESPEIGKIPVQNSPLWKGDPDQQLSYYAGRALCRRHFPDVLLGVYAPDEMEMMARRPEDARDVTPRTPLADRMAAIATGKPADKPAPAPEQASSDQQDEHDPETGEIKNRSEQSDAKGAEGDVPSESSVPDDALNETAEGITDAEKRGEQAANDGLSRRAMPGEYRESDALANAWLRGFDRATDDANGEG